MLFEKRGIKDRVRENYKCKLIVEEEAEFAYKRYY